MANKLTEGPRDLAFILTEANGNRSRDTVTFLTGHGVIEPGTALGKITASDKFIPSPNAVVVGKEGAETAIAIACYRTDTTDADVEGVVVDNDAEVKIPMLRYDASVDDAAKQLAKRDQLAAVGIRSR